MTSSPLIQKVMAQNFKVVAQIVHEARFSEVACDAHEQAYVSDAVT